MDWNLSRGIALSILADVQRCHELHLCASAPSRTCPALLSMQRGKPESMVSWLSFTPLLSPSRHLELHVNTPCKLRLDGRCHLELIIDVLEVMHCVVVLLCHRPDLLHLQSRFSGLARKQLMDVDCPTCGRAPSCGVIVSLVDGPASALVTAATGRQCQVLLPFAATRSHMPCLLPVAGLLAFAFPWDGCRVSA